MRLLLLLDGGLSQSFQSFRRWPSDGASYAPNCGGCEVETLLSVDVGGEILESN